MVVLRKVLPIPFGATTICDTIAATLARHRNIARIPAQAVGQAISWT